jgi:aryl sulfotransferase
MSGRTAWLASYPKSGNTWVRAWLNSILRDSAPELNRLSLRDAHNVMDPSLGLSIGDLSPEAISAMMRLCWATGEAQDNGFVCRKTHHAWVEAPDGYPISWQPEGAKAVYIVRDPRAVAVSWAHHAGVSLEKSVEQLATDVRPNTWNQPRPHDMLSTWSNHVRSWTSQKDIPVHVVTYESMVRDPATQLTGIAQFLEIDHTPAQIDRAVEECSFANLATREIFEGFVEAIGDRAFFRRGEIDSWREELPTELAERVVQDHSEVMKEFGYLE